MTARRRPLWVSAVALLLPACLHTDPPYSATQSDSTAKPVSTQTADPLRKTQFAELLSRPGTVIPANQSNGKEVTGPIETSETGTVKPAVSESGTAPPATNQPNQLPESPLVSAVRATIENHPDKAIEALSVYDKPNQELVLEILNALVQSTTLNMVKDPTKVAMVADQLRSAAEHIESRAALRIEGVALCASMEGFGRYDPWPKGKPYRPHELAQLYIEVRNLVSQPAVGPNGESFLTHARASLEIRDAHGGLVDQPTREGRLVPVLHSERNLFTRTPVHDFSSVCYFTVPPTAGVYTVTIKVEDSVGKRSVKLDRPIEFRVAGP
jgi:hypothetical protein